MITKLLRPLLSAAGAAALAAGLLAGASGTAHADGRGPNWYGVWASSVNVRTGGEQCHLWPSTSTCPIVKETVSAPRTVYVHCQTEGSQTVGGNPYWVWVQTTNGSYGFMASYYIQNQTNWIDGVPQC